MTRGHASHDIVVELIRVQSRLELPVEQRFAELHRLWARLSGKAPIAEAPKPIDLQKSFDAEPPRLHPRWLETLYRALPFGFARRMKEFVFVLTGPLFSRTLAHRRWRAHVATQGARWTPAVPTPEPRVVTREAPPPAEPDREWGDYAPMRTRIVAELRRRAGERPRQKAMPLLDFSRVPVALAAAAIVLPAASPKPMVSILVAAYNHIDMTLECVASIAACTEPGDDFEVLVADDASTDATAQVLAGIGNLRVVSQPENLGFLRNCNAAAMQARGRYLLLLNNDAQVTPGWLHALLAAIDGHEDVGATGPRFVYPDGMLQEAGAALRRDGTSEMIGYGDWPGQPQYNYRRNVDYVSGACLLLRRADFESLGGFDERYAPAYCEDVDLCLRLRERGKRIVYCPDSLLVHHLSRTSNHLPSDYKLNCVARNQDKLVQRWQSELERLDEVRTIAFYLPQFHPIPENDRWWGEGFTEWSNVRRARPNFRGHDQPRVPADLGYYDLRDHETMLRQAELARRYGVGAFCYYYYWFAGKRLLEAPLERMLASGKPDFPFCLCWANENWTRRWDGREQDVLIGQHHSEADDAAVIADLMRYFRSDNYLRIDGRPLLLVYRVALFPDFASTAANWRRLCREAGIGEIYLAMVESFEMVANGADPASFGCDAAVEFPPHGLAQPRPLDQPLLNPAFNGAVADYREVALHCATRPLPKYRRFPGVMPGWDNTPRRQDNSYSFEHATPGAFQAWLETAIARSRRQYGGDERLVFINAWNEWAEGAYLEPDQRHGHGFLAAHANAIDAGQLLANRNSIGG
jgi:GT2 family glycosyltransferase